MVSAIQFVKEVRSELGKVVWPTKQEAIRLTSIVIGVSLGVGLFIGAFDYIFTRLMELLLAR